MSKMKEYCEMKIKAGIMAKEDLQNEIKANPLHAISWAEKSLETIAIGELCKRIVDVLNKKTDTEKNILFYIETETIKYSQWKPSSTSQLSNFIETLQQTARGRFCNDVKYYI